VIFENKKTTTTIFIHSITFIMSGHTTPTSFGTQYYISSIGLLLLLLGWHHGPLLVDSYPGGAGACLANVPSVGGNHLERATITNTSLKDQSVVLKFSGVALTPGVRAQFLANQEYTMELTSSTVNMRGCLTRFAVPDGTDKSIMTLTPVENTQMA
jgi:hypothetical protein